MSLNPGEKILVFDIGGTSLRGAIYHADTATISQRSVEPTPNQWTHPELSASQLIDALIEAIERISAKLSAQVSFAAVSIAFPGPVDLAGNIIAAPGIWGQNPDGPLDLRTKLAPFCPRIPTYIANDLTAAGYRYLNSECNSFCLLTVSTGIGNKIFINGQPQLGRAGISGEIGHLRVSFDEDAPLCDCGERGHLQAVSSGRGALNLIKELAFAQRYAFEASLLKEMCGNRPQELTNPQIAEAFRDGDAFTVTAIESSIQPLAQALATLHMAQGLERFILIGGFAFALGERYRLALARLARLACWDAAMDWEEMLRFGFEDDDSGLIGGGGRVVALGALPEV
ncbi:MAG: ROK family protein [Desulfuromonadales bacterium]|nr:ROK family protein [Desulfuromonadales bacterium]